MHSRTSQPLYHRKGDLKLLRWEESAGGQLRVERDLGKVRIRVSDYLRDSEVHPGRQELEEPDLPYLDHMQGVPLPRHLFQPLPCL